MNLSWLRYKTLTFQVTSRELFGDAGDIRLVFHRLFLLLLSILLNILCATMLARRGGVWLGRVCITAGIFRSFSYPRGSGTL